MSPATTTILLPTVAVFEDKGLGTFFTTDADLNPTLDRARYVWQAENQVRWLVILNDNGLWQFWNLAEIIKCCGSFSGGVVLIAVRNHPEPSRYHLELSGYCLDTVQSRVDRPTVQSHPDTVQSCPEPSGAVMTVQPPSSAVCMDTVRMS